MHLSSFKKSLLVILGVGLVGTASAQTGPIGSAAKQNVENLRNGAVAISFDNRYQGVVGHPYFLDVWVPGSVVIKRNNLGNTETFSNVKLKYDVHGNQVAAVLQDTKDTLLLNSAVVSQFNLELPSSDTPLLFKRYPEAATIDPKLSDVFFAVLHDGKIDFTKRIAKSMVKADFKGGYSAGRTSDELVDNVNYYFVIDKTMYKVKLSKKGFLDALPAQAESKMKDFINSNKLNMSTEEDFKKALAFYDSI